MNEEDLYSTTGLLYKNDIFIGSGVIFCVNDTLFCLTAGHNLYGKNFDTTPDLGQWTVRDHHGDDHRLAALNSDLNFAEKNDIVLLQLECASTLENFICPKFLTAPKNPSHSLMFRGKYESSEYPVNRRKITYNGVCNGNKMHFICDIERSILTDDLYNSGSDWLGGWSGSGLFIDNHTELLCVGILIEIPNKGNDGQLHFVNLEVLKGLNPNLQIHNSEILDYDKKLRARSLDSIFNEINEQAVVEWEMNDINKPQLQFINDKIPLVYAKAELEKQKRTIIKAILVGKSYLALELKKNEHLNNAFNNAKNTYNLEGLTIYADNKPEARAGLSAIKKDYEAFLRECLAPDFDESHIKLLALYSVSDWIAVCSLSILEND